MPRSSLGISSANSTRSCRRRGNDSHFSLDRTGLELLVEACHGHTHGDFHDDVTVQTCWDSDRLDLGRVGIVPDPGRLGTAAARRPEVIAWAYRWSIAERPLGKAKPRTR